MGIVIMASTLAGIMVGLVIGGILIGMMASSRIRDLEWEVGNLNEMLDGCGEEKYHGE